MRNKRNAWVLLILLISGAVIGGLAGEALSRNEFFSWMSFGGVNGYRNLISFSLNPLIDARVLRLGFDFSLSINAGSIIGMLLGILAYTRL